MTTLASPSAHAPAPERRADDKESSYRPELDGLRTVAVYSVLLFHAGVRTFSGGFVGVDVFFVLSGFLITRLLLTELSRTGRIGIRTFYARRMRRLLPASWATLVIGSLVATAVLPPLQLSDLVASARSGFLWFANWHFIGIGNDYFHAEDGQSPFLHYWSLSLEEQFYVLWPALLLGAAWFARRRGLSAAGLVFIGALAGAAASVAWTLHLAPRDPVHAYYGTETRAYQLLAGAALAAWFVRRGAPSGGTARRTAAGAQLLGLLVVLVLTTRWPGISVAWRGIVVTLATVAVLAGMEVQRRGPSARFLANDWMARLGRISYGTYLWHWVVIVTLFELTDWWPTATALVTAVVATGLAAISAVVLERPIRGSRWLAARSGKVVAAGVVGSVALALLLPTLVSDASPVISGKSVSTVNGKPLDWKAAKTDGGIAPDCYQKSATKCVVVDSGPKAPVVLLMGDSHARSTIRMFASIAREKHWTLAATIGSGCPWQWGMLYPRSWGAQTDTCAHLQDDWYDRVLPDLKPTMTYLVSYSFDDPSGLEDMRAADPAEKSLDDAALADRSVARSVHALRQAGSRVTIVLPFPVSHTGSPLSCLSKGKQPRDCDFVVDPRPIPAEARYRAAAAADDGVKTVDLDRVVCPELPRCAAVIDGLITHRDHDHVTATFLEHEAATVERMLRRVGAEP
ncbi:MAG TPA: acyltransferase family protein [Mycobacteriales bacterium]|nr:acyltransferase family protein [Mycobacteriales bacterium]